MTQKSLNLYKNFKTKEFIQYNFIKITRWCIKIIVHISCVQGVIKSFLFTTGRTMLKPRYFPRGRIWCIAYMCSLCKSQASMLNNTESIEGCNIHNNISALNSWKFYGLGSKIDLNFKNVAIERVRENQGSRTHRHE